MEFEKLLQDPRASFNSPSQIVNSNDLSKSQKIELLRRWEYDENTLQCLRGIYSHAYR